MKTLENIYIDIYSENISEHEKTTTGGVRIEIEGQFKEYSKFVLNLTKREAKELAKILREKA